MHVAMRTLLQPASKPFKPLLKTTSKAPDPLPQGPQQTPPPPPPSLIALVPIEILNGPLYAPIATHFHPSS